MVFIWYLHRSYSGCKNLAKLNKYREQQVSDLKAKLNILLLPRKKRCFYVVFIQKLYIFAHRKLLK
jgi:hypothetical protein